MKSIKYSEHFNSEATVRTLNVFICIFVTIVSLFLYWDGLDNLISRWLVQEEYSHGFLVPFVSLYMLWEKEGELRHSFVGGSWWGFALCGFALAGLFVGEVSALFLLVHLSFLVFLCGFVWALCGWATLRIMLVPIAFLGFAIPLPYFLEVILTAKMQLISSSLGVQLIRLFGIPVYLSGNIIDLGSFKLHVVEACSGMRYLFPLMSIGFVAAYFYRANYWKKMLVFVTTIPVTIVMNSIRIGITGLLVENYGSTVAEGFLHDFEGWVVFLLCLLVLLCEVYLLEQFTGKASIFDVFMRGPGRQVAAKKGKVKPILSKPSLAILVFLVTSFWLFQSLDDQQTGSVKQVSFASFPLHLGEWTGIDVALDDAIVRGLGVTDYLQVDYKNIVKPSQAINLYVAYYDNQRKGVSPHSPKVCMPGGGWEITQFNRVTLNGMPVNRSLVQKGEQSQLVYYWFVERGQVVANEYIKKWMLFRDALTLNRTDGSLVRVVTPILQNETIEDAEARIAGFVGIAQPRIQNYLPAIN
ncbi:MAG: exosortase D (VPLPA-CTERM-specific) [Lentisphaeria bacterium]|jgi:exosortase D (VPLPA-CTERM-specific)